MERFASVKSVLIMFDYYAKTIAHRSMAVYFAVKTGIRDGGNRVEFISSISLLVSRFLVFDAI